MAAAVVTPSIAAALRLGLLAAAALTLACAGGLSAPLAPWNAVALPSGLALAALWRWGRAALSACVLGMAGAALAGWAAGPRLRTAVMSHGRAPG